jgi:hypothetical protein
MNRGKYVFAQISSFLPQRTFDSIVARYKGDHSVRHFTCWNQLMCMMYGQLSSRESLRDLVLTVNAHAQKAYHLGSEKVFLKRIWQEQMRTEIGAYTKSLPIISLQKQERYA